MNKLNFERCLSFRYTLFGYTIWYMNSVTRSDSHSLDYLVGSNENFWPIVLRQPAGYILVPMEEAMDFQEVYLQTFMVPRG